MRISARFWAPVLVAILIVGATGGIFLWQIDNSIAIIEHTATSIQETGRNWLKPIRAVRSSSGENEAAALAFLRQGEIELAQGSLERAEGLFTQSVDAGGGVPALRKLIAVQVQRRKYNEARQTLSSLKKEDDDEDIFLLEGLLELRSGNKDDARRMFDTKQNDPDGQYGLAIIALVEKRNDEASTLLRTVAESEDPTLRTYARSILHAFTEFALFPEGKATHLETLIGRALAQVNECELALPLLTEVVTTENGYRDAWIVKGFCEFSTERTNDALISLEHAYNLDPEKPETQYFLARTYNALGDQQNAVTFLQYAIVNGFEPEREARELLATFAINNGNSDLALEQLRALAEEENSDIGAYEKFIALAVTVPSRAEDAYQLALVARSKWPDDVATLALLAEAEIGTGRLSDAEAHLNQALNIDPTNSRALKAQELLKNMPEVPNL